MESKGNHILIVNGEVEVVKSVGNDEPVLAVCKTGEYVGACARVELESGCRRIK